jgi:heat shock protein HslJ
MTTSRISHRRPAALWAVAALSTALLAACAAPSHNRDADAKDAAMPSDSASPAASASNGSIELGGYRWTVDTATDKAGRPIAALQREGKYALTLSFVKDRLGVSGGCNHVGAQYAIKGAQLEVKEFQTTLMACQDARLMQMDTAISQQLQGSNRFAIEGEAPQPRLRLTTASGSTLNLSGEATAETRYGSAGATVFLEVDAQRRSCPHPLIRDHQCLWVRERSYDANGVAQKPSDEWHFLYQDIEGYQHEAGVRNVVRVKKFQIKNPPADAPSEGYVLDMVVESELVPAP